MQPRVNDRGAKSISVISTQTNRALHLSTPLMLTWGISDFVDERGESDGKYSMSLVFPLEGNNTPETDDFLSKLKSFEEQVLNDAVKNSELWFGEEMSLAVAKHTFFPFLKYTKDKMTKKIDPTKSPSIRAKVPLYSGRWMVEIYNTKQELIFPCDNDMLSPIDFVPKKSNVACVLQCGGLWFGGKGWGITWKVNQIIVKPFEVQSVFGKCHIQLSSNDIETIETSAPVQSVSDEEEQEAVVPAKPTLTSSVQVEDSDVEEEEVKPIEPVATEVKDPTPPEVEVVPAVVVPEVQPAAKEETVVEEAVAPVKKKIIKKKVAA